MKSAIVVGTRGSKLALTQTNQVIDKIKSFHPELEVKVKIIKTTGDLVQDKELSKIGGKGLFIKEIEEALLSNEIDLAVHSMKDVPHTLADGFQIGAILKRERPEDVLIMRNDLTLDTLPLSSTIGTGSLRRILQLRNLRADLNFKPLRGNIDTRLNKLANGDFDAVVLAAAGLKRLGWNEDNSDEFFKGILKHPTKLNVEYLKTDNFIPAVGQGALTIEIRKNDKATHNIIKVLNDINDAICVAAERAFLREINGGCEIPIGAYATLSNDEITIKGFVGNEEKSIIYRETIKGNKNFNQSLGIELARKLKRSSG